MSDTLSKIEKRTAYILLLPAVFLVFSIILFPIFANVWISFKEVGLKDIRIPEPRAKKIVKSIKDSSDEIKIIYKLRNSSLILDIRDVKFQDKTPKNVEPLNLDERCQFKSNVINCNFGQGYFGTTAVASAGTNASDNGIFEYDVPTGYTALSTKGLNS